MIKQNLLIYPHDLHIDFKDPIDQRIEDEYLMNYNQDLTQTKSNFENHMNED